MSYRSKNELSWCSLIRSVDNTYPSGINTMNIKNIVNDFLINSSPMHKMRRLALVECINSIVNGNSLTVMTMGRGIESKTFERHSIKRNIKYRGQNNIKLSIGVRTTLNYLFRHPS
jgi:hypothetical protein